jgi:hypothetical protein
VWDREKELVLVRQAEILAPFNAGHGKKVSVLCSKPRDSLVTDIGAEQGLAWQAVASAISAEQEFADCAGVDGPACQRKFEELLGKAQARARKRPESESGRSEPEDEVHETLMRCLLTVDELETERQKIQSGQAAEMAARKEAEKAAVAAADGTLASRPSQSRKRRGDEWCQREDLELLREICRGDPADAELERMKLEIEKQKLDLMERQIEMLTRLVCDASNSSKKKKKKKRFSRI